MDNETENNGEGIQEDSIKTLEQEYKQVFNSLKTAYQAFVTSYLKTLDSKQAAIAAGYSKKGAYKQGNRLVKNDNISLCISLQQRINSLRGKVTTAWILEQLKENYERCMQAKEVFDKQGNRTGMWTYNAQAATRCLELMGQHLGMFGKGKEGGDLHLHDHKKYVNYPPVPESIGAWVDQMKQVGYAAALPQPKEAEDGNVCADSKSMSDSDRDSTDSVVDTPQGEDTGVTPIGGENRHA